MWHFYSIFNLSGDTVHLIDTDTCFLFFQRLLGTDQTACDAIRLEINISKQLSGHPHIVDFISAAIIDKTKSQENRHEFLLLSELCTGLCFHLKCL